MSKAKRYSIWLLIGGGWLLMGRTFFVRGGYWIGIGLEGGLFGYKELAELA